MVSYHTTYDASSLRHSKQATIKKHKINNTRFTWKIYLIVYYRTSVVHSHISFWRREQNSAISSFSQSHPSWTGIPHTHEDPLSFPFYVPNGRECWYETEENSCPHLRRQASWKSKENSCNSIHAHVHVQAVVLVRSNIYIVYLLCPQFERSIQARVTYTCSATPETEVAPI